MADGHNLKRICSGSGAQRFLPIVSLDGKSLIAEIWYGSFVLLECHIRNIFHEKKTHVATAFIHFSLVKEMFKLLEETSLRIYLTDITNTHSWWKDRKRIVVEPETIDVTPWNASSHTVKQSLLWHNHHALKGKYFFCIFTCTHNFWSSWNHHS